MAGSVFVVCVPTKAQESKLVDADANNTSSKLKSTTSASNLENAFQSTNSLGARLGSTRSDDSIFVAGNKESQEKVSISKSEQAPGTARKEMFIGPWRVDASDLPPLTPLGGRRRRARSPGRSPGRSPRSPLVDMSSLSRSDPEGIGAKGSETPVSNFKKRRHRYLEDELQKILRDLKIKNAVWCEGREGKFYQVLFTIESREACEEALKKLAERGIGVLLNSVVSVLPCTLFYQGAKSTSGSIDKLDDENEDNLEEDCPGVTQSACAGVKPPQSEWEQFVQSVRARLTVAQVVEGVRANAGFTFDFLLLLIVASFSAALGFLENSTVILVASVLISPLMGPVMAATFGTMINDRSLRRMGLVNECAGLLVCLSIGLCTGLGVGFFDQPVPTAEMIDRGQLRSLWVNTVIAMLSGAGIAIALLRDNTGSLVGVAISASLMPPAVNAGLLWAMAFVFYMTCPVSSAGEQVPEVLEQGAAGEDAAPRYSTYYSDLPHIEMAVMGGISLCITFINIVFIYITGTIMLKVKEVAPHCQAHQLFWAHDVKVARDYNTTLYGTTAADMLRSVVNKNDQCAVGGAGGDDCPNKADKQLSPDFARLWRLSAAAALPASRFPSRADARYLGVCPEHQLTWSPNMLVDKEEVPSTVRELQGLYRTIRLQEHCHQDAAAGPGHHGRRSSFSNGCGAGAPLGVPSSSWRLGSSDGYRCIRAARAARGGRAGGQVEQPGARWPAFSPPYSNMPAKQLDPVPPPASAQPSTPFLTPRPGHVVDGDLSIRVPVTPASLFRTPLDMGGTPAASTVVTLDGGLAGAEPPAATVHRPPKRRRFVVTRTEDAEALLSPAWV